MPKKSHKIIKLLVYNYLNKHLSSNSTKKNDLLMCDQGLGNCSILEWTETEYEKNKSRRQHLHILNLPKYPDDNAWVF